jgi:hypothetical protein
MPDTPDNEQPHGQLRIWQQNPNKSLEAQTDLLHSLDLNTYDIAMLQEPYVDWLRHTRANTHWTPIYPLNHLVDNNYKKT